MMASVHLIQPVSICRIWYVSTCSLLPRSGVVMVCDYIIDSRTSLFTSLQDSCDTPRALRCFFLLHHILVVQDGVLHCFYIHLHSCCMFVWPEIIPPLLPDPWHLLNRHWQSTGIQGRMSRWYLYTHDHSRIYAQRYWYRFHPYCIWITLKVFKPSRFLSTCTVLVVLRERLSEQYVTFTAARHVQAQVGNTRSAFNTFLFFICLKIFKQSFGP